MNRSTAKRANWRSR